jgi:hypothetical protein
MGGRAENGHHWTNFMAFVSGTFSLLTLESTYGMQLNRLVNAS